MSNPQKRRGDAAEREAADLISSLLDIPARRALGAGRQDDIGDIHGIPGHAIQVASWKDVSRAALVKPREVEQQRQNAGAPHASTFVRFRGGNWRVVLTPEQWAALARLTISQCSGPLERLCDEDIRERIAQGLDQEQPAA